MMLNFVKNGYIIEIKLFSKGNKIPNRHQRFIALEGLYLWNQKEFRWGLQYLRFIQHLKFSNFSFKIQNLIKFQI